MASVTFFPQGTQLDNDKIADLQVNIGDGLEFSKNGENPTILIFN